jgi:hemolysin III
VIYSLGAVVYATKRPNPSPTWFGFHEVFHLMTVLAFVCHYIAVSIATYSLR